MAQKMSPEAIKATRVAGGKRLATARDGVDRDKSYSVDEAVKLVKERAKAKFDETIEVAMNLGVDPKHADQMVRGVCNLPNGSGRTAARRGVRARSQGRGGEGGRRRHRRRGGSRRADHQGQDQLRPLHRDARHDGSRRPARQGSGPARPDAEPARRHRDDGRHDAPSRAPRAARWSSASRRPASCMPASARRASREGARREHQGFRGRGGQGQAAGLQGNLREEGFDQLHHGARRQDRRRRASAVGQA